MNTTQIIIAVLSGISQILPLLLGTKNADTTSAINGVISIIEKLMPLIVDEISAVYQSTKNIIAALSANPATTAEQAATLAQFDAQVDAAFEAAAADVDPDAPSAA
jgi:tripartite-type tricarboxylate transporter receptor subunit TctC